MRPQDIIVLIKMHIWNQGRWKIIPLAESIHLSKTETQKAIERIKKSLFYDLALGHIRKSAMEEFFIHGIKYCFPAEIGSTTRGIPTAHTAQILAEKIASSEDSNYVWAHGRGTKRGLAVKPLYKTAPDAALEDPRMHLYLALIDAIRIGKTREQSLAKEELVNLIRKGNNCEP